MHLFKRYIQRRSTGASVLELMIGIPVLIAIAALSLDLSVLLIGADFCDRTCKDCARAAGQMSTPDEAVNAMNATATAHSIDGFLLKKMYPELLVYEDYNDSTNTPTPKYGSTSDFTGKNGPRNITPIRDTTYKKDSKIDLGDPNQTSSPGPYVTVCNTLIIRIPVIITFFGAKLFVGNVQTDPDLFKIQSTYTFPITNTYSPDTNLSGKTTE